MSDRLGRPGSGSNVRRGRDGNVAALLAELDALEHELEDVRPSARRLGVAATVLMGAAAIPALLGATRWGVVGALISGGVICLIGYAPSYLRARALERAIAALARRTP